ncbi:MAG: protocatechuate 3,4-dioxygenase subunit beta [Pseudomonadota bacterium]
MNGNSNSDSGHPDDSFLRRDNDWQPPAFFEDYRSTHWRSPRHDLVRIPQTASEVSGPLFAGIECGPLDHDLLHNFAQAGECAVGQRLLVHGRVVDQNGRALPNTLLEVWQANAGGRYRHCNEKYTAELDPNFAGCGRCLTDEQGCYRFYTVQPGAYPWPNGPNSWRPAHIHFSLFGEAFVQRLITQMYFEGDPLIPLCPIVNAIPDASGVERLTARLDLDATVPMDCLAYRFDIVLRGRQQTPFENRLEGL